MTPEQIETLIYRLKHETWSGFQGLAGQAGTALAEQATELKAKNKLLEDVYATDEREFVRLNTKLAGAEAEIAALKQSLHRVDEKLAEVEALRAKRPPAPFDASNYGAPALNED